MTINKQRRSGDGAANLSTRLQATLRTHNGTVSVQLNGQTTCPLMVELRPSSSKKDVEAAVSAGVELYFTEMPGLFWLDGDRIDSEALIEQIAPLELLPSAAALFVAVRIETPEWWLKANPEELAGWAGSFQTGAERPVFPSFASERWRKSAGLALARLLRFLSASAIGRNIVGVQVLCGDAGAFLYPHLSAWPDSGPRMRDAFRDYALSKYRKNEGLLRKGWFDARAEFSKIECPNYYERTRADYGVFRNPHKTRKVLDYWESLTEVQSAAAIHMCSVVRRELGEQVLVGLECAPVTASYHSPEAGHTISDSLTTNEAVDFWVETRTSNKNPLFKPYRGSLALNGKMVFVRSQGGLATAASAGALATSVGAIVPIDGLELNKLTVTTLRNIPRQKRLESQVALVLDPASATVIAKAPDCADLLGLIRDQCELLTSIGAPVTIYSVSDTFSSKFPTHRLVLLPDSFYLSEAERRKVDARFKRSGQTVAFFWGAGAITEERICAEASSAFCGQKVRMESGQVSFRTRIATAGDPLIWGRHVGEQFGLSEPIGPVFTVTDKEIVRLGANSNNKTTFATKRQDPWTSVVFGSFPVPLDLMRNLVKSTASHIFCDGLQYGDQLHTDGRLLSLTTAKGGLLNISLPGVFDCVDLFEIRPEMKHVTEFTLETRPGETVLIAMKATPEGDSGR